MPASQNPSATRRVRSSRLWEQGVEHGASILASLGVTTDLSQVPVEQREVATRAAMDRGEPLIYRGRLSVDDLLGEPDLLELQSNGGYVPGAIKSGSGLEGGDDDTEAASSATTPSNSDTSATSSNVWHWGMVRT